MLHRSIFLCFLFFISAGATQLASAAGYAGLSIGNAKAESLGLDFGDDRVIKLSAGYRGEILGLEAGYTDLGKINALNTGVFISSSGFEVSALIFVPLASFMDIYGKAGMFVWDSRFSGLATGSDNGSNLTYGLGTQFNLSKKASLRFEYQQYSDLSGIDYRATSLGMTYSF